MRKKNWFNLKKPKSCKLLGHEWKRSGLRYHVCIHCGVKKKVRFLPPRL